MSHKKTKSPTEPGMYWFVIRDQNIPVEVIRGPENQILFAVYAEAVCSLKAAIFQNGKWVKIPSPVEIEAMTALSKAAEYYVIAQTDTDRHETDEGIMEAERAEVAAASKLFRTARKTVETLRSERVATT